MNDLRNIHDEGLSPAAHAALAALRAEEDEMPAAARERVWARLAETSAPAEAPGRGRWRGAVIGLAIAAGLALALIELGRGAQPIARAPRGEAARYDGAAPADERAARRGALSEAGAAQLPAAAGEVSAGTAAAAGHPAVPEDRSGGGVDTAVPEDRSVRGPGAAVPEDRPGRASRTGAGSVGGAAGGASDEAAGDGGALAAEAALLQRAQTALAAGDPEGALRSLGEHARGFKDGVLARERDALRVTALCAAGRTDEGRAEGEAFLRAHAGSLLAERVRGACEP